MRIRALDVDGDWEFGKGQNNYLTGQKAVAQNIQTRLLSFLGDCFFDVSTGIDWFTYLGGKDQIALNLAVSATILNTRDVTGILQLGIALNRTTRNLVIRYRVQTTYSSLSGAFQYDLNGIA